MITEIEFVSRTEQAMFNVKRIFENNHNEKNINRINVR